MRRVSSFVKLINPLFDTTRFSFYQMGINCQGYDIAPVNSAILLPVDNLMAQKTPLLKGYFLVELLRKSLHQIVDESKRWRRIIGPQFERYRFNSQFNIP